MDEMIIEFFVKYGWQLTLIALGGIVILGIMKACKLFEKVEKENRKYIYAAISTGFSAIGSLIYLLVTGGFEWISFLLLIVVLYMLNQTMYAAYETYGIRKLFKWIVDTIKKLFNKNKSDKDEYIE